MSTGVDARERVTRVFFGDGLSWVQGGGRACGVLRLGPGSYEFRPAAAPGFLADGMVAHVPQDPAEAPLPQEVMHGPLVSPAGSPEGVDEAIIEALFEDDDAHGESEVAPAADARAPGRKRRRSEDQAPDSVATKVARRLAGSWQEIYRVRD